jgi:predicted dehydrogenase
MKTSDEIAEILGEQEICSVSMTFWLEYHDRLDPGKSTTEEAFAALLAFQNGWLACKEAYSINT